MIAIRSRSLRLIVKVSIPPTVASTTAGESGHFHRVQRRTFSKSRDNTNQFTLRRVSHKARNPKNKAEVGELAVLDNFRAVLAEGKTPAPLVRTNALGGVTYFAPIVLNNPLCLNCHGQPGTDIRPEHLALLRKLYPRDEATGFKFGELRGPWRIDFKPEALRSP